MILVPEIETVIILVPRTGTKAIRRAVAATYPGAVPLYRHMEADGVPCGYDRWRKVGVIRHPVDRLWSLYKYLRQVQQEPDWAPGFADRMRASAADPFDQWIVGNETVFTHPYWGEGGLGFWPRYTVRHPLPENRKSQFLYLRPDLGTQIWPFSDLAGFGEAMGLRLSMLNATDASQPPPLSEAARSHISRWFAWDLGAVARLEADRDAPEVRRAG